MNGNFLALALGALAGMLMAIQGTLNAMLSKAIGIFETSFVVNLLGLILSGILLLVGLGSGTFGRYPAVPWYASLGGILGVGIIYGVSTAIGKGSAATATTAIIAAQVLTAAILDHFGLFGLRQTSITLSKGLGMMLLVASAYLVLRQR